MRKIQFGCGGEKLEGWENYDMEIDITKPIPFKDNSVRYILAEHVIEHVHVHDGYRFIKELYRILEPQGTARLCVPGLDVLFKNYGTQYSDFLKFHKLGDGSLKSAMESIIFGFDHKATYTTELLSLLCKTVGFDVKECRPRLSDIPELNDIDSHWKPIGEMANSTESVVLEITKPAS